MELHVLPQPAVADALSNYVEARIHSDTDELRDLQRSMVYTISQPTYAIVDPVTLEVIRQAPLPLLDAQTALEFLLPVP